MCMKCLLACCGLIYVCEPILGVFIIRQLHVFVASYGVIIFSMDILLQALDNNSYNKIFMGVKHLVGMKCGIKLATPQSFTMKTIGQRISWSSLIGRKMRSQMQQFSPLVGVLCSLMYSLDKKPQPNIVPCQHNVAIL